MSRTTLRTVGRKAIGVALDPKRNSLNFLRLVLAFFVVYGHASELGWLGLHDVILNDTPLSSIAVYGFFGISGYLIAGSASKNSVGRYLWQRFLRIFPAFWVCLVVTAFALGAIALAVDPLPHCGFVCYLKLHPGPFSFVYSNALLKLNQVGVAGPQLNLANGSLWTLFYEFLCYLLLAALSFVGVMRHRGWVALITLGIFAALLVTTLVPNLNSMFGLSLSIVPMNFMVLSLGFLGGTLIYLYRERVPDSVLLAIVCIVGFVATQYLPTGGHQWYSRLTPSNFGVFLLAYPLLWLGAHLPFYWIGSKNDYSYGVYIYAYPLTQLLISLDAERFGFWPFILLTALATLAFAVASWWLIEKHALRFKKANWPTGRLLPAIVVPGVHETPDGLGETAKAEVLGD
jgi:peptidoglycan/LPS O-acetylase OafA/YrhL